MKKAIALVSALAVVFCCSFPAFATTPTGRRREASYDYGDVSLHVSVDAGASVTYNNDVCHYDHRFTVTLTNKTNTFQVADQNILGFKLYTGRKDYFDNTFVGSSGTTQTNASWGAQVTSYSDNMTVPDIKFYTSVSSGWEGSVYIKFTDSDLLVLNPNETRTYNFTIDFIASQTAGAMPINGNYVYGYFTYLSNSSISIFNKPNSFTSNTISDFMNNDSLPNSVIAWLMANYDAISSLYNNPSFVHSASTYSNQQFHINSNDFRSILNVSQLKPYIYSEDLEALGVADNNQYLYSTVYCIPIVYNYSFVNYSSTISKNISSNFVRFNNNKPVTNYNYIGSSIDVLNSNGVFLQRITDTDISFGFNNHYPSLPMFEVGSLYNISFVVNYYYGVNSTSSDDFSITTNVSTSYTESITVSDVNGSFFASFSKNFADLRDRIQSILDSYTANSSSAEDVTDSAVSSSNTIDNQHQTESNYFSDSQSAIQDTGIQNFQFTPQESAGLNGLKDDFTAVWVSCGTLSRVWITSLTIGLALAIIRHRRMFEK